MLKNNKITGIEYTTNGKKYGYNFPATRFDYNLIIILSRYLFFSLIYYYKEYTCIKKN